MTAIRMAEAVALLLTNSEVWFLIGTLFFFLFFSFWNSQVVPSPWWDEEKKSTTQKDELGPNERSLNRTNAATDRQVELSGQNDLNTFEAFGFDAHNV